jgi:RNA polymerase-associated protein LEO1
MSSPEEFSVASDPLTPPSEDGLGAASDVDLFGDDEPLDSDHDRRSDPKSVSPSALTDKSYNIEALNLPRHVIPDPSDNELYLLKIPPFFAVEPRVWDAATFEPPTTEHHTKLPPPEGFSAYETALSTIRWRRSPSDPEELQSNARFLRWSDGSLTMQLAMDPSTQYEISAKPLAPRQTSPPKPTPVASSNTSPLARGGRGARYDPNLDAHTYLAEPIESAYIVRTTRKFTAALVVRQPSGVADTFDAIQATAEAITAKFQAQERREATKIEDIRENPEEAKKEALRLEREYERRRAKEERDREKTRLGRAGLAGRGGGGLTLEGLEGEGAGARRGGTRPRAAGKAKQPRRARRDSESDEEEELYGRRGGPQDQYDMEDDFVVDSDASGAEDAGGGSSDQDAEGEEDIDAILELQERQQRERKRRGQQAAAAASPKRAARESEEELEVQASPVSRSKRRRVVVSDEDDE